jgi:ABC-type nitrate/sulfonate/bicarbonate transport system permease component
MTAPAHAMTPRGQPTAARFSVRVPNERMFYALLGLVGLMIAWQLASNAGIIKKILMSSPIDIARAAVQDFTTGAIWPHLTISFQEWILGFLIAIAVGIPFGFALGYFRRLRLFSNYWLFAVDATPSVALFPLIVLVLGIGLESKIFMVFLACIFQILLSTMQGVRAVNWRHEEIANSFRASTWRRMRSVVLPTTIPFALTGIRLGASRALVGVVTAEFLAANQGIGYYIALNGQTLQTSRVFVGLVMLGVFGILLGEVVRLVEHRFDAWRPTIHR